jgi:hypothetical protein
MDGELCMKHTAVAGNPKLATILIKHVDELKMAGVREEVIHMLQQLEKVFGTFKIEWDKFTNSGVRHNQNKATKDIFDQTACDVASIFIDALEEALQAASSKAH